MRRLPSSRTLALALSCCSLAACGGGGGDSADAAAEAFEIESISVAAAEQGFQLNRPITVRFNRAVNPSTVSPNTISLAVSPGQQIPDTANPGLMLSVGGLPAIGDYTLVDERTVVFQPACPTTSDLGSGGLLPNVEYTLHLPGEATNGFALAAASGGQGLDQGFTLRFRTVAASDPGLAFLDTVPGPPAAILRPAGATSGVGSRLEIGGNPNNAVYFTRATAGAPGMPSGGFLAPLNLYSDQASRVEVVVEFDQAVNPAAENFTPSQIRLEYQSSLPGALPVTWQRFESQVVLERNCTASGARVRITPLGPLPQDRALRVVVTALFSDLVGQTNDGSLNDFAVFPTRVALDPGTATPGDALDEVFESFLVGAEDDPLVSLQDLDSGSEIPPATWEQGRLEAAFSFEGTGGPQGTFDVFIAPNADVTFNTVSQSFVGGPGGAPQATQVAVDGVLDCRDLFIPASSTLKLIGPNTGRILASGNVRIDGTILLTGNAGRPIFTLNTANLPEPGASGNAGGGQGGTGSPNITQVSPRGGNGNGAFNSAGTGGQGGESGYNASSNEANRRGAGGGGGRLGPDVLLADGCADQTLIGLDAEQGLPGGGGSIGAVFGLTPAQGGLPGISPFVDSSAANDFWGNLLVAPGTPDQELIRGELDRVWAGGGGGGGGDATITAVYPPATFILTNQDKGAGGGGGAGGLVILAIGDIVFGPQGRIVATGGTGAGGENTNFTNRVGGGSGGGSGGHIVLQSASQIDFSLVPTTARPITALGGQGGAGNQNTGGFDPDATSTPGNDAKPAVGTCPTNIIAAAGGDGGPGIIQLHAQSTADIVPPVNLTNLRTMLVPKPIGLDLDANPGLTWDGLMLPVFGRRSRARSVWIPLGGVHVQPGSLASEMIEFLFQGIDPATGLVQRTGSTVNELPPVASGALVAAPGLPSIQGGGTALALDITTFVGPNDIYRRNPSLARLFLVRITQGATINEFDVAAATADEVGGRLVLTVAGSGTPLSGVTPGATFELIPRFFEVSTNGQEDFLPPSASVRISFQATTADVNGEPNEIAATPEVTNVNDLNNDLENPLFRFVRFIVDFDIAADASPLSFSSPRPSLDFLRLPFRF